ncbi:phospho-sugar mutase [Lentibacillus amyloliquefaciens]|uniref:Phosphoglucomutase n=1 Tax=Lentibacillus amyloliquefaciens TaxID=1472767 RepID=A0A0U4DWT3_9BACI|nr:phospho-sugar mutase [Lentibacillus amyloliquefaciens]ALX49832.1 phosphoglucomutase [Lentibacillus amyloliquefaciens]
MSQWEEVYEKWRTYKNLDPALKQELDSMKENETLLEDAFYTELTFGTGGLRGVLGPGINRMNRYTVRKAVDGLANYLKANHANVSERGVAVSYDSRYMSQEFALETAKVLGAHGIRTYVFNKLHPTPLVSFALRHLEAVAGVMITASHNPPEYNGFKVYNEDGGQITPDEASDIIGYIQETEDELTVPYLEKEQLESQGFLTWIGQEIDDAYMKQLREMSRLGDEEQSKDKNLQIVFTPLHGTAHDLVLRGLKQLGFNQVDVVEEQAVADPEFSTVESPNPEEHQAFSMAIKLGEQTEADILIGTDPDADRLGVAVKQPTGKYTVLTGNQLGALMLDYILSRSDRTTLKDARMLKTIVTSELGRKIADYYDVKTIDTLTGFKYIGEKIRQFDATGETFIFGYEESYGYLISDFARDKDAVQAAVLASEMAYYWKAQGKTLFDALHLLFERHGFFQEDMMSLTLKGKEGSEKIASIMENIRKEPLTEIGGLQVQYVEDYLASERKALSHNQSEPIELPQENVVKYILDNESWVCLRPSGTEPKIKCYFGVCEESEEAGQKRLKDLKAHMEDVIK